MNDRWSDMTTWLLVTVDKGGASGRNVVDHDEVDREA